MQIINYEPKYKDEINKLQADQWGDGSDSDEIIENLDKYQIKLVIEDERVVGAIVWHLSDAETCYIDFIVLKPAFQHIGIGSKLMNLMIEYAVEKGCLKIECEVIDVNGKINAKNLVEKFGFKEQYEIKNYWGGEYPDFACKECGQKPCVCSMHKYLKILK